MMNQKQNELIKKAQENLEKLRKEIFEELENKLNELDDKKVDAKKEEPKSSKDIKEPTRRVITVGYTFDGDVIVDEPNVVAGIGIDHGEENLAMCAALAKSIDNALAENSPGYSSVFKIVSCHYRDILFEVAEESIKQEFGEYGNIAEDWKRFAKAIMEAI